MRRCGRWRCDTQHTLLTPKSGSNIINMLHSNITQVGESGGGADLLCIAIDRAPMISPGDNSQLPVCVLFFVLWLLPKFEVQSSLTFLVLWLSLSERSCGLCCAPLDCVCYQEIQHELGGVCVVCLLPGFIFVTGQLAVFSAV